MKSSRQTWQLAVPAARQSMNDDLLEMDQKNDVQFCAWVHRCSKHEQQNYFPIGKKDDLLCSC
jgi:hypothetical protein